MPNTPDTPRIPILMYHQIAPKPKKGTPFRSLVVSPESFARQMGFLRAVGYQGLSMHDLQPYLKGEKIGKVFGLTFDDGYLNNLTNALPVLQKNQFSSTCYVVSQLLGKTNVWDDKVGIPSADLMGAAQLKQWLAAGQEVGAHTRHHVHLNQLDAAQSALEIQGCKTELEQSLDTTISSFCYPYGQYSALHVEQVKSAGYQTATTTQRGNCSPQTSPYELKRIIVARSTLLPIVWLKVATHYETYKANRPR